MHPYVCVADSRAAIQWYGDVFGATVSYEPIVMEDNRIGHVELSFGGARLMMSDAYPSVHVEPPDPSRGNAVTLYLTSNDVDGIASLAVERGATLDRGPEDSPYGRVAVLRDPFGHRWMLSAEA